MIYRTLGQTGFKISAISFGTVKIGRNQGVKYPQVFDLPDDGAVMDLLDAARDAGINLIDTAPAYGTSEERLGELLTSIDGGRDFLVSTKAGEIYRNGESTFDFTPEAIRSSVERSANRLRREVLDLVLVHSDGNDLEALAAGSLDALQERKSAGMIRACGFSGKTVEGGIAALEAGADVVMVTHNLTYDGERAVIDRAHELNRGVLIKKALNSGHLTDQPNAAELSIRHSLDTPGVTSLVIGTLSIDRMRQNAAAAG